MLAMTEPASAADSILIVDFGSQVTQLIARRIREAGVYCEIHPFNTAGAAFKALNPKGVILSGGPASTLLALSIIIAVSQRSILFRIFLIIGLEVTAQPVVLSKIIDRSPSYWELGCEPLPVTKFRNSRNRKRAAA